MIEALPAAGGCWYDGSDEIVTWVPHVHVATHAPLLTTDDLLDIFRGQWPGPPERVDVEAFFAGDAAANAGAIIGYATKHEMRIKLKDQFEMCWPVPVQAAYRGWLHGMRNGLAPLRVRIGPIRWKSPTECDRG